MYACAAAGSLVDNERPGGAVTVRFMAVEWQSREQLVQAVQSDSVNFREG
jgi:hypothetical protein